MKEFRVIGQMSGTSLDGIDLAYVHFKFDNYWSFQIINSKTYEYSDEWREKLKHSIKTSAYDLISLDREYGNYLGGIINHFIKEHHINKIDFIGSHGHTVFHQPEKGVTLQIGNGANISATTQLKTICDFRTIDVALGGQGAPLVPIGDRLLFGDYDYCLNLGGFANISFEQNNQRLAFDICPANILLNHLAYKLNAPYDFNGEHAAKGVLNKKLFDKLNAIPFYNQTPPKSLGKEWLDKKIIPIIESANISIEDKLSTACQHIAFQISQVIKKEKASVLITGGGAYNQTLINFLKNISEANFIIPSKKLIDYKEALIFAFLAVLRNEGKINCLSSVTGGRHDSISGAIYLPTN